MLGWLDVGLTMPPVGSESATLRFHLMVHPAGFLRRGTTGYTQFYPELERSAQMDVSRGSPRDGRHLTGLMLDATSIKSRSSVTSVMVSDGCLDISYFVMMTGCIGRFR